MVKTSRDFEKEFLENLERDTGHCLTSWLHILKGSGMAQRTEMIGWLKQHCDFGHMHASLLAGVYFNAGSPMYAKRQETTK